jgi:C4-dicarboxylate-specific signal transduction histidine kinase
MFSIFSQDPNSGAPSYERTLAMIHPDDRNYWASIVQECLSNGRPHRMRFRIIHPDKKVLWAEAILNPRYGTQGEILGLTGTCQDVDDIVRSEETMKLERSKALISAKLASLGEMSAGIAHEINNPLAIISGAIHLLKSPRKNEEEWHNLVHSMERAADRIGRIVSGLKKFSRTSEKNSMKEASLNKIIEESLVLLQTRARQFAISIKVEAQQDVTLLCDEIEIEQVIINLVNNSIDAIRNEPEKWILIKLEVVGHDIILSVEDSGRGIPPQDREKLFQPFFTTKQSGEGTGLGLSIVKGIMEEHGARITLNEQSPHTCFELRFKEYRN